jgi:hypothetical protein
MSGYRAGRRLMVGVVVVGGLLWATRASADFTYSWSGHLRLYDDAEPDPWLIGADGAEFVLQTTVSDTAVDDNTTQVPFAAFTATGSRLWVDGEEVAYVSDAYVDFQDLNDFDLLTAGGTFSKFGQVVEISSVVGLGAATFSFNRPSELPPYFSATSAVGGGRFVHRPYVATVGIGTLVTVVPEPESLALVFAALALLVLSRFRWSWREQLRWGGS